MNRNKTDYEKLKEIEYIITEEGVDTEGLIKYRRKLYRFKDYELTNREWIIKHSLLNHIKELLVDERG